MHSSQKSLSRLLRMGFLSSLMLTNTTIGLLLRRSRRKLWKILGRSSLRRGNKTMNKNSINEIVGMSDRELRKLEKEQGWKEPSEKEIKKVLKKHEENLQKK